MRHLTTDEAFAVMRGCERKDGKLLVDGEWLTLDCIPSYEEEGCPPMYGGLKFSFDEYLGLLEGNRPFGARIHDGRFSVISDG